MSGGNEQNSEIGREKAPILIPDFASERRSFEVADKIDYVIRTTKLMI